MSQQITATLVDTGSDGWRIYHLDRFDRLDTIRVGAYDRSGRYRIEILRDRWHHLAEGYYTNLDDLPYVEGIERAATILFHGPSSIAFEDRT